MVTILLLIVIYIAFIGLGIPDSLFGTAWPAIYSEYGLPLSFGSFVTVIISSCTALTAVAIPGVKLMWCMFLASE